MLPPNFTVDNATTETEVLRRLSSFVEYLQSCHVDTVLPRRFAGLSARSVAEVRSWTQQLSEPAHYGYRLSAAGHCWLEEIRDAFTDASRRLDALHSPFAMPGSPSRRGASGGEPHA